MSIVGSVIVFIAQVVCMDCIIPVYIKVKMYKIVKFVIKFFFHYVFHNLITHFLLLSMLWAK